MAHRLVVSLAGILLCGAAVAAESAPLSLWDAMRKALTGNSTIQAACDGVIGAQYEVGAAEGELGLRLTTQSGSGLGTDTETSQNTSAHLGKKFAYGTDVELSAGNTSTDGGFYRSFSGLTVSQSVLRGFGREANTARIVDASRQVVTNERQLSLIRDQAMIDVATAFARIVEQKIVIGITLRSLAYASSLVQASEAKLERGLVTKGDVLRAQTRLTAAEGAKLEAEDTLDDARDELRKLLGLDDTDALDVQTEISPTALEGDETALTSQALERRLDVLEATDQVKDAERDLAIAKRSLLPDLRVGVNYSMVGSGSSFGASTKLDDPTVSLVLSTDVFLDRSTARARYGQAALEVTRHKRALNDLRQQVARDVRTSLRRRARLRERLTLQEAEVVTARSAFDLASLRFDRGYASNVDVLQAEDALATAQRGEIHLRIEQLMEDLQLRAATGSLSAYLDAALDGALASQICARP